MINLKPYTEVLKLAKEKIDEHLAPVRAKKAKKQAELKIAELDETLASLESDITNLCCQKDINFDHIIEKQDEYELAERKKSQLEVIIKELFPK